MPLKVSVSDIQKSKAEIRSALGKLMTNKFVTVGIHDDAGSHPDTDLHNAQLGATLHFGTDTIPARPWLDAGVAQGNKVYLDIIADGMEDELLPAQILEQVGVKAAATVQQYMTDLRDPPNAPETIRRKGSSNPLIDTGALRQSVTYKIQGGKPNEGIG
jgi:hypothetical protein